MMSNLKLNCALLLVVAVSTTFGRTLATTNEDRSWSWSKSSSINLFKEALKYLIAVINKGIPSLGVPPLDPYFLNVTSEIQMNYDPRYPYYTDLDVKVHGITFSGFSIIDVIYAYLNLSDMWASVVLFQQAITLQSPEIVASAVNSGGQLVYFNCSGVVADIFASVFTGQVQLEFNGTQLRVAKFDNHLVISDPYVEFSSATCTGDSGMEWFLMETLSEALYSVTSITIPDFIANLNFEITTVLNDIFALRNITDDDSVSSDGPRPNAKLGNDNVSLLPDVNQGYVKRLNKQNFQKGVDKSVDRLDERVMVKWTF